MDNYRAVVLLTLALSVSTTPSSSYGDKIIGFRSYFTGRFFAMKSAEALDRSSQGVVTTTIGSGDHNRDYKGDDRGSSEIIPTHIPATATTPKRHGNEITDSTQVISSSSSSSLVAATAAVSMKPSLYDAHGKVPKTHTLNTPLPKPNVTDISKDEQLLPSLHDVNDRKLSETHISNTSLLNPNRTDENKIENEQTSPSKAPQAFRFFGHYPFHDMDMQQRQLWLERVRKGGGSLSVEGTFLWTSGMIGTVANGAVFLTAAISKYFRRPLHIMVSTLAFTDLYVTFLYIPSYTYFLVERNRDLDDNKEWSESIFSYCNVTRGIFIFGASLSVTIQAFIALYLFIMTCSKDLAGRVFTTKNTIIYIASACIGNAITLFLPSCLGYSRVDFYPNGHLCSPLTHEKVGDWHIKNFRVFYHCFALTLHIAELLLICFFIVNIFLAVVRGKLVRVKYGRKDRTANMNYSRAMHVTIIVFSCFMLLWLPLYIVNFVDPNHDLVPDAVHHLVFDLLLIKSCANPLIYIYAIKTLRFELRLICMCKLTPEERRKALTPPKKTTTSYNGPSSIPTSSYGF